MIRREEWKYRTRQVQAALGIALALAGCAGETRDDAAPLLVLAASDLQVAFEEILSLFEARTGERVSLVLGSTGNLATQIRNGAPGDLFFAANESFLEELIAAGRVEPNTRRIYALGRLVLVAPPGRDPPAEIASLAAPGFEIVAIANPEHAPYGIAARDALERAGLWDWIQPRLVLGENVSQTYQLVRTGNADVGIVALGLVMGAPGDPVPYTLVGSELHAPLRQAAGVVTGSARPEFAQAFLDLVLSPEGQEIMARYGFEPPPSP